MTRRTRWKYQGRERLFNRLGWLSTAVLILAACQATTPPSEPDSPVPIPLPQSAVASHSLDHDEFDDPLDDQVLSSHPELLTLRRSGTNKTANPDQSSKAENTVTPSTPSSSLESGEQSPEDVVDVKPFPILWFHGYNSSLESLQIAVNCPAITHVMLESMHPNDTDWRTDSRLVEAIRIVKNSPARLIWCRNLTPYYQSNGFVIEDLYDPQFYIQALRTLRNEAEQIGADATAFDTEPYAYSPFKALAKETVLPSADVVAQISSAVQQAIRQEGQANFVLPAGSWNGGHPYDALAALGQQRIAESTYSGRYEIYIHIPYAYDIVGFYLNLVDRDEGSEERKYTLVDDLFHRPELWAGKAGIFLFPKRPGEEQIAARLSAEYARFGSIAPIGNSN